MIRGSIQTMKDPSTQRDLRVALVGFGLGGASFHAPLIAATPGSIGPDWGQDPPEYWGVLTDGAHEESVPSEPGAYQRFYGELLAMLRGGAPPPVAPEDALAGLEIIEAAQRSVAERSVVALRPDGRGAV